MRARGQGRSHAVRLAEEGADIIAVDICQSLPTVPYEGATPGDLDGTAKLVEDLDRRIVVREADVRDLGQLEAAVQEGLSELGHIDVVCCNAGIGTFAPALEMDEQMWQEMIDVNLTGVWKTIRAAAPPMVERRQGGSIIITSSVAGLFGFPILANYSSAKHGVVGLMRTLTQELAPYMIRVNSVHPTTVNTPMIMNDGLLRAVSARPGQSPARRTWGTLSWATTRCRCRGSSPSTSATRCCGWRRMSPAMSPG